MGHQFQTFVDTAFVLFVVFTCAYSLFGSRDHNEEKSRKWIDELSTVKDGLRELIGEASAASSNLDRRLLKRKQELEKLLEKIESKQTISEDDFPNETWRDVPVERASERQPERQPERTAARKPEPRSTARPVQQAAPQAPMQSMQEMSSADSQLSRRIEVLLDGKMPRGQISEDRPDPTAYKIAKRLLESGKELHLVARKVGIPLEELRVLDSMIKRADQLRLAGQTHIVRAPDIAPLPSAAPTYTRAVRVQERQPEVQVEDQWEGELNQLLNEQEEQITKTRRSNSIEIKRETAFL